MNNNENNQSVPNQVPTPSAPMNANQQPMVVQPPIQQPMVQPLPQPVQQPMIGQQAPVQQISQPGMQQPTPDMFGQTGADPLVIPAQVAKKKKLIIATSIAGLIIILSLFLFVFSGNDNSNGGNGDGNTNTNTNTGDIDGWDPSTSKIVEIKGTNIVKLTCTAASVEDEVGHSTRIIASFKEGEMLQIIVEESVEFVESTMRLYNYYAGYLAEIEPTFKYDNVITEIRRHTSKVSLVLSIDLAADSENPKNEFAYDQIHSYMTYDEAKDASERAGYTCR